MAELFSEQAAVYAAAEPVYPKDLFAKLAALTDGHRFAWDVGTGNGQAAIGVAEHYDRVLATDASADQLRHAVPHPKVRYPHTADTTPEEELVAALGGEGSVDLITVAQAVHWFDLPAFYAVASTTGLQLPRDPRGGHAVALLPYHPALPGSQIMVPHRRVPEPAVPIRAHRPREIGPAGRLRHGAGEVIRGAHRHA
uniref:Methyltransferase type 11 domain-containing protein n=1 Tax=Triticum urartu TaxID=4572 RepID=A0A8R7P8Q0_TRIUA